MRRYFWSLLLLLTLTACGNQLTKENFSKVTQDMTTEQVKGILGEPKQVDSQTMPLVGNVTVWTYKTDKSTGTVIFRQGKATVMTYQEEENKAKAN